MAMGKWGKCKIENGASAALVSKCHKVYIDVHFFFHLHVVVAFTFAAGRGAVAHLVAIVQFV